MSKELARRQPVGVDKWEWFGHAAHFICGHNCRFHMATKVGKYLVSTVGELWSERGVREIHAKVCDPKWLQENQHLLGDSFDSAYMKRFGYEDIGCNRKYESMVFLAGKRCKTPECGCGLPELADAIELDFRGYQAAGAARAGHMKLCQKWSKK